MLFFVKIRAFLFEKQSLFFKNSLPLATIYPQVSEKGFFCMIIERINFLPELGSTFNDSKIDKRDKQTVQQRCSEKGLLQIAGKHEVQR